MAARAIWKGTLHIGDLEVLVKMYSAVQDRTVHLRLLDERSRTPVHQKIVRKSDGKEVPEAQRRKAYVLDRDHAVILTTEELEALEPASSREIKIEHFVPPTVIGDQWYDRPYYLGPDDDEAAYFALSQALERQRVFGIARWVMRKKRYIGALAPSNGYLTMLTLRRSEQVLSAAGVDIAPSRQADEREIRLAEQLVDTIAGTFDPRLWQNEYRQRIDALIEAKLKGKPLPRARPRPKVGGGLAEKLQRSLATAKERKVA
jgi:DNA end-binding protein Ku